MVKTSVVGADEVTLEEALSGLTDKSPKEAADLTSSEEADKLLHAYNKANDRYNKGSAQIKHIIDTYYSDGEETYGLKFEFSVDAIDKDGVKEMREGCFACIAACAIIQPREVTVGKGESRKQKFEDAYKYIFDPANPRIALGKSYMDLLTEQVPELAEADAAPQDGEIEQVPELVEADAAPQDGEIRENVPSEAETVAAEIGEVAAKFCVEDLNFDGSNVLDEVPLACTAYDQSPTVVDLTPPKSWA